MQPINQQSQTPIDSPGSMPVNPHPEGTLLPVTVQREDDTNTMAIFSLVASLSTFITGIGFIAGIVLGHMSLREIKKTGERGEVLAKTALAVGYLFLVLAVLMAVGVVVAALMFGVSTSMLVL